MAEVEDEAYPGVAKAVLETEVLAEAEDRSVGDDGLVVVLEGVGEAELLGDRCRSAKDCRGVEEMGPYDGHEAPVDLPDYALVCGFVNDDALML